MSRKCYLTLVLLFLCLQGALAQDSLLSVLKKEMPPEKERTIATFKSIKIINAQTNETTAKRTLDFRIAHRFGNFLSYDGNGTGGFHNFYGLDDPNFDIRIEFDYGISDRFMAGISRSKKDENLEGHLKFRLIEQSTDDHIPLSLSIYTSSAYTPMLDPEGIFTTSDNRFSYATQAILARKFSPRFSLELIPSWVHRNLITNPDDNNDIYSLGGGGRWKFTKSAAIIADYFYDFRTAAVSNLYYNPLGAGVEIETGGHVFSIMFSNAQYLIEQEFIPNTTDSWAKNGWKFCFNISRVFPFKKGNS